MTPDKRCEIAHLLEGELWARERYQATFGPHADKSRFRRPAHQMAHHAAVTDAVRTLVRIAGLEADVARVRHERTQAERSARRPA